MREGFWVEVKKEVEPGVYVGMVENDLCRAYTYGDFIQVQAHHVWCVVDENNEGVDERDKSYTAFFQAMAEK
eukprot:gene30025-17919_t